MKQHRYRLTLEHLATAKGEPGTHAPLRMEVGNHDDLFAIIERARAKALLDDNSSTAMVIGLKLFGEVMLENRDHPLFAGIREPLREFILKLKKTPGPTQE